jgi:3-dehydroquinate dehydratase II
MQRFMPNPTSNKSVLVINGPNLNLLGTREPEVYGKTTLDDITQKLQNQAINAGISLDSYQSNHEGELIDRVQKAKKDGVGFIIINPGGFTHTSVALRDALAGVAIPFIEVHLSNIHQREEFRKHSYFSDLAIGVICGLGAKGYELALNAIQEKITSK